MINLSIKIDNRQYQQYLERKKNAVYAFKKKADYEDSIKINVTEEKMKKRCYTCEKKKHLRRNYKKTRKEICIIDETEWEDLVNNQLKDNWFKNHVKSINDSKTQDINEESLKIKFAELKSRFSWTFLKDVRLLLTTIRINILKIRSTILITTNEDSCQIMKELVFKATKEVLYFNNVVINLINRYKNVYLHLCYDTKEQKKIAIFKVLNNFRYYVILDVSD